MELSDIASVAGKGGLYKVLKPSRTGVILESMDKEKKKLVAHAHQRVSVLNEISIYTTDAEGSKPLEDILQTIYKEFGDDTGIEGNASKEELMAFLKHILPNYDEAQVYPSDIKKLIQWYDILLKEAPEVLKEQKKESKKKKEVEEDKKEENK